MHRADTYQMMCAMDEQELWDQEDSQQETGSSVPESVTMRQLDCRRGCPCDCRSDSPARLWPTRPVSLSSASSSDSGVRGDMSDASSAHRLGCAGLSADSGCAAWDELDENDWDSCSDASGEYEPLRQPLPPLLEVRTGPAYSRSLTHPPPPPPRPPPGTLPRRKDLTRHLGLPRELGGSLAELRAGSGATVRRKDLSLFLGMTEASTPPRTGLWRRWTTRRGARPGGEQERDRSADPRNGSLPDLARIAVGSGDSVSMPSTPCRRRAAASPRLLRAALRKVQERALRAVARSGAAEVAGLDDGTPTLVFQAKRGSFEAPSVLFSGDRWHAPSPTGIPTLPIPIRHKPRLPTPPPELPSARTWSPSDWASVAEERLPPPPLPEVPPPAEEHDEDPAYMTMEAIRALTRPPLPPPRLEITCDDDDESGYLPMDAVRQLVRQHRAASPTRPRLGSDYANLADLRAALAGLRVTSPERS